MRNLILTGGIRHDFADNTRSLTAVLQEAGVVSEVWEDLDAGIERLSQGGFDLVTVMALRWPMEGDAKYAPYQPAWGYRMPSESSARLERFVADGGGLFGLHTAALCFDDWDGWRSLLGGRWRWGRSFHPPRGPVAVRPLSREHPLVEGLQDFTVDDEVFSDLDLLPEVAPLLTAVAAGASEAQPVLWARPFGKGRVVYDALGHDRASLEHPVHRRIIMRCALWAAGARPPQLATL